MQYPGFCPSLKLYDNGRFMLQITYDLSTVAYSKKPSNCQKSAKGGKSAGNIQSNHRVYFIFKVLSCTLHKTPDVSPVRQKTGCIFPSFQQVFSTPCLKSNIILSIYWVFILGFPCFQHFWVLKSLKTFAVFSPFSILGLCLNGELSDSFPVNLQRFYTIRRQMTAFYSRDISHRFVQFRAKLCKITPYFLYFGASSVNLLDTPRDSDPFAPRRGQRISQ